VQKIIVCEPGKQPEVRELEKLDLDAMQAIVGGLIQCVSLTPDIDLWFNEEGRIRHLPFNRMVTDAAGQEWDIIGPMFIATAENEEDPEDGVQTAGLSDLEILAWSQRLTLPEVKIPQVEPGLVAVFHAQHPNFAGSYMWDIQPPAPWPSDFKQVAWVIVGAADEDEALSHAWQQTNHVDRAWQDNDGVKSLARKARSSAVGDVFVLPGGKAMRVDSCGFIEVA